MKTPSIRRRFLPLGVAMATMVLALLASSSSSSGTTGTDNHNNWAVLVCASRFWFNYRHIANTLSMYRTVKRLGIPDSNIVLMLADDVACNARNPWPAKIINNADDRLDLYGDTVEVDYRGYEVTAEAVIRLLTDRLPAHTPRSKRLATDHESRILVFMTGHGGDEFLKFQDKEELGAQDLADAFTQMYEGRRYKEILFMVDTCQANTMYQHFRTPGILASGSSQKGESSYSHHMDRDLGVAVIDRYTYYTLDYLEPLTPQQATNASLADMFRTFSFDKMSSTIGVRDDLFDRGLERAMVGDFFGGSRSVRTVAGDEAASANAVLESLRTTDHQVVPSSSGTEGTPQPPSATTTAPSNGGRNVHRASTLVAMKAPEDNTFVGYPKWYWHLGTVVVVLGVMLAVTSTPPE
ncbi:peptidase C13 family-domain-containing protein [Blastocladiella britannica]|nr:peptidase C13 family-domain-containing protein [Blastocladiella britannica]